MHDRGRIEMIAGDDDRCADMGDLNSRREFRRQAHAAMRGGIAGQLPACSAMPDQVSRFMFGIGALL